MDDTPLHHGYVYMQVFLTYKALVDGANYNEFDWQLVIDGQDLDTYIPAIVLSGPTPELMSGTLKAGQSASGWIVYEVPPTGPLGLYYAFHAHQPVATYTLR
jgi:hypothetical protein